MKQLVAAAAVLALAAPAAAQKGGMTLELDARDAPRRLLHARLTLPATAGPMTLLYPQWIPGEHGPDGPVVNVADLEITAGGKPIAWQRDPDSMFALHLDVPAGATSLTVRLDYLAPADTGRDSAAVTTPELARLQWNQVVFYPQGAAPDELQVAATLRLPPGWKAGTSLPIQRESGGQIAFAPVSLTTLVDSPVLAGAHTRLMPLKDKAPPVRLFVAADSEQVLEPPAAMLEAFRRLPLEAAALFGAEHFRNYTFLLAMSDSIDGGGLEHHESSDNRTDERFLVDESERRVWAGLLPHEMVHSWNGKYRRPAGLQPGRFDTPMRGELLWIYEGLTEYLGQVLTARSGLATVEEYRDELAVTAASMSIEKGRTWRPLADTAVAAQLLYGAPHAGKSLRRSVDFYPEGELLWLEVDTLIRARTGGKASLDDFCRRFHGGESGAPKVVPYALEDVIAGLNAVAPNDWKAFFQERVYAPRVSPPLAGIEAAGWTLVYGDQKSPYIDSLEEVDDRVDARFSIGVQVDKDGTMADVIAGSPAAIAGVPAGAKLIAVNGQKWSGDRLRDAIRASKKRKSVELIVESGELVFPVTLSYSGGERYPRLERIATKPDLLTPIVTPLTSTR